MNRQLWHWLDRAWNDQDSNATWIVYFKQLAKQTVYFLVKRHRRFGHISVHGHDFNNCFGFVASGNCGGLASGSSSHSATSRKRFGRVGG
jgi:hypothetical protein